MAIFIVAIVGIAAYVGLQTAITSSMSHRELAVAETLLRSASERLQSPDPLEIPYVNCATGSSYPLPAGVAVVDVRYWAPSAPTPVSNISTTFVPSCPAADGGLQLLTLQVTTPSGHVEQLDVLKRRG